MNVIKQLIKFIIIVALIIVGISVLFLIWRHINKEKFNNQFESLLELREELIIKIKNNEIEIDEYKIAKLSEKYEKVATNGKVRVLLNDDEETLIGFLYRIGFPDEEQYIFYTTEDEDFIREQIGNNLCNYIEKITDNWYFVQYN